MTEKVIPYTKLYRTITDETTKVYTAADYFDVEDVCARSDFTMIDLDAAGAELNPLPNGMSLDSDTGELTFSTMVDELIAVRVRIQFNYADKEDGS